MFCGVYYLLHYCPKWMYFTMQYASALNVVSYGFYNPQRECILHAPYGLWTLGVRVALRVNIVGAKTKLCLLSALQSILMVLGASFVLSPSAMRTIHHIHEMQRKEWGVKVKKEQYSMATYATYICLYVYDVFGIPVKYVFTKKHLELAWKCCWLFCWTALMWNRDTATRLLNRFYVRHLACAPCLLPVCLMLSK